MRVAPLLAACLLAAPAAAGDGFRLRVEGLVDLRAVRADDTTGWLDGGLGKLRFGGEDDPCSRSPSRRSPALRSRD